LLCSHLFVPDLDKIIHFLQQVCSLNITIHNMLKHVDIITFNLLLNL
jgi:hypothetical protein